MKDNTAKNSIDIEEIKQLLDHFEEKLTYGIKICELTENLSNTKFSKREKDIIKHLKECVINNLLILAYSISEKMVPALVTSLFQNIDLKDNKFLNHLVEKPFNDLVSSSSNAKYEEMHQTITNISDYKLSISKKSDMAKDHKQIIINRHSYAHTGNYYSYNVDIDLYKEILIFFNYLMVEIELINNNQGNNIIDLSHISLKHCKNILKGCMYNNKGLNNDLTQKFDELKEIFSNPCYSNTYLVQYLNKNYFQYDVINNSEFSKLLDDLNFFFD